MMAFGLLFTVIAGVSGGIDEGMVAATPAEIPHFARQYGLECAACHVSPPKLNEFGEEFVRRNYRLPEDQPADVEERRTLPFAVWASSRMDLPPESAEFERGLRSYLNRIEVVSGGQLGVPWLSYFVEWRPLSLELRPDGTLKDRSGRFEDLFVSAQWDRLELSLGQFRQVAQVDISRRLGVNEPGYFSSGLPGRGSVDDARLGALRSFSLSGRAPTARIGWIEGLGEGWDWTTYASVSVPGELSIPLTTEARSEASNEVELRPKGVFVESFVRRGVTSYGAHAFFDSTNRYLIGLVATGRRGDILWTGAGGGAGLDGSFRLRASAEAEYIVTNHLALGLRAEGRRGSPTAFIPYLNAHFPGTSYTIRLTFEHRQQSGSRGTFLELGAVL